VATRAVLARAKVNLFLRVLGRRPDGYHELETVILPISLADRLEVRASADPAVDRTLSLSLEVTGKSTLVRDVPVDRSNLALRAAAALAEEAEVTGFAKIRLEKRIPVAAGLGGGSADAAAALRALNELWECGADEQALCRIAARIGSDVPSLIPGGPTLARGRGELVERIHVTPLQWRVVTFDFGVSAADAFRWWDEDGERPGPDPGGLLGATPHEGASSLGPLLFNDLEGPVMRRHPEVRQAEERLLAAGAVGAVMCGSGPSVAGLFPDSEDPASSEIGIAVRSG